MKLEVKFDGTLALRGPYSRTELQEIANRLGISVNVLGRHGEIAPKTPDQSQVKLKNESTHYSPENDEIVPGLRCETASGLYTVSTDNIKSFCEKAVEGKLRVKYLDEADLKELGYRPLTYKESFYAKGQVQIHMRSEQRVTIRQQIGGSVATLFHGRVKNLFELQTVLKMIDI